MRRLASLATAQTAAAGSQFVQKSKSGAVGALYVDVSLACFFNLISTIDAHHSPSLERLLLLLLPVTVLSSIVAAWLLTHEIKGFMRPELQQVVREEKREKESE